MKIFIFTQLRRGDVRRGKHKAAFPPRGPGFRIQDPRTWSTCSPPTKEARNGTETDAPLSMLAQIVCHAVQILRAVALVCGIMRDLFLCLCGSNNSSNNSNRSSSNSTTRSNTKTAAAAAATSENNSAPQQCQHTANLIFVDFSVFLRI